MKYILFLCFLTLPITISCQSKQIGITPSIGTSLNLTTGTSGINFDGVIIESIPSNYNTVTASLEFKRNITDIISLNINLLYRPDYSFKYIVADTDEDVPFSPIEKVTFVSGNEFQIAFYPSIRLYKQNILDISASLGLGYSITNRRNFEKADFNGLHLRTVEVINSIGEVKPVNTFFWTPGINLSLWNFSVTCLYTDKISTSMTSPLATSFSSSAFINNRNTIDLLFGYTVSF